MIPESVTEISSLAFSMCTGLTRVEIPGTVSVYGYAIFSRCSSLTELVFFGDAPDYDFANAISGVFRDMHDDFKIFYDPGKKGWCTPSWYGYPAFPLEAGEDR